MLAAGVVAYGLSQYETPIRFVTIHHGVLTDFVRVTMYGARDKEKVSIDIRLSKQALRNRVSEACQC